jgi:hypothetical protein
MHPLTKAVKLLTVAVWCLCALMLAHFLFSLVAYLDTWHLMHRSLATTSKDLHPSIERYESSASSRNEGPPLHELPPEQMVAKASAILLATYRKEGGRNKAIVTEILKQTQGTKLYYALGDEYAPLSNYRENDQCAGEGFVVFMSGSPANMEASYGYINGRISGLGDMPLQKLREMINASKK